MFLRHLDHLWRQGRQMCPQILWVGSGPSLHLSRIDKQEVPEAGPTEPRRPLLVSETSYSTRQDPRPFRINSDHLSHTFTAYQTHHIHQKRDNVRTSRVVFWPSSPSEMRNVQTVCSTTCVLDTARTGERHDSATSSRTTSRLTTAAQNTGNGRTSDL